MFFLYKIDYYPRLAFNSSPRRWWCCVVSVCVAMSVSTCYVQMLLWGRQHGGCCEVKARHMRQIDVEENRESLGARGRPDGAPLCHLHSCTHKHFLQHPCHGRRQQAAAFWWYDWIWCHTRATSSSGAMEAASPPCFIKIWVSSCRRCYSVISSVGGTCLTLWW